ncbi:MAG: PEGA domain-containing protein [Deltaproteobacteria bacterium]|nr:PEGA domain-containing protein [Deltaproteobacteria bacterium]
MRAFVVVLRRVLGILGILGILAVSVVVGVSPAQAQDRFVVLRTIAGSEPPGLVPVAESIEAVADRQHTILTTDEATNLITLRHSTEPAAASRDDFDALARESEAALEHVAFGRRRQARRAIESILERAQGAIEALNRESRSARRILNSCLYLVRALDHARDEEAALDQAVECARLVPDMQPSAAEHPPVVRRLFDRAVARIESGPHGSLNVQSEPSGCAVFLNGRRLGATPFSRENLATGEYRVQVECEAGRPGRVHRIVLAAEPRDVMIDSRFDRALRNTDRDLRLEYVDADEENAYRLGDATAVAGIMGVDNVILITAEGESVARVDWIRASGVVVASVRVAMNSAGAVRESLDRGMAELGEARSVDATGETAVAIEPWAPPAPRGAEVASIPGAATADASAGAEGHAAESDLSGLSELAALGWVLGGVGVATYAVAWSLQGVWIHRDGQVDVAEPDDVDYADRVARRDDLALPVSLLAASGAVLTTAALPFLLGDGGTGPWHWIVGGVGVAVAAVGIGLWTQDNACVDPPDCREVSRTVPLAPLLVTTAVPMIAVPILALILGSGEDAHPNDLSLVPTLGPEGAGLILGGTL